jgi:hypothetical protein
MFDVRQAHSKIRQMFFVGYPRETKGYYFYKKVEGKVFIAHNDIF